MYQVSLRISTKFDMLDKLYKLSQGVYEPYGLLLIVVLRMIKARFVCVCTLKEKGVHHG